jgi:anthranilate phosphoribosyltransferase
VNDGPGLKPTLGDLITGRSLSETEAEALFETIIAGAATPAQIGAVLMALSLRGETADELTGAVRVLRRRAVALAAPEGAIDCCGTGGDGLSTLNISTAVAFVVAACGVPVAKHGNRAASSRSGAADVLTALGLDGEASPEVSATLLDRFGIAFLFAPNHHPAMRAVAGVRRELGFRSIFNLAGPLANPAGARRQLVGVYHPRWLEPVAEALRRLGSSRAWVVHGAEGLDELSITGPSHVAILADGHVTRRIVTPEEAGLAPSPLSAIVGGEPAYNAAALLRMLEGEAGGSRDIVLLNTAAALIVAGRATELPEGVALAAQAIDGGGARALLGRMLALRAESAP